MNRLPARAAVLLLAALAAGCALPHKIEKPRPDDGTVSLAPEPPPPPPETNERLCERADAEGFAVVDETREALEETSCRAALWLDGMFGENRNVEAARRAHGFLETSVTHSEFLGTKSRTRLRVNVELPNLKERVSAFFGRDDEDDFIRDRSEAFAVRSQFRGVDNDDEWLAGLGYSLPTTERLQTGVKVGVSGLTHPKLFVQARILYSLYSDEDDLVYVRGIPFWNTRVGLGFTAGADWNHVLTPTLLLRWANVATISEKTEGVDWYEGLILYQNLREQRALAWQLFARGQTDAAEPLYEYGGRVVYRHPLIRDRLYGEFLAGYSFPREDPTLDREGSYEVGAGIEIPFGEKPN